MVTPLAVPSTIDTWETRLFSGPPQGWRATEVEEVGIDARLSAARRRIGRVSVRQAFQEALHRRGLIVDIRPQAQRLAEGEIDPSLNVVVVERNVLEWRFDPRHAARLPQAGFDARLLVLCQEGYTSSLAAEALIDLGVLRTVDVIGGLAAWRRAGLPVRHRETVA